MPPKKDKKKDGDDEEEEIVGYNINLMNSEELKKYAHMLEKEIEEMRKHCSFYQIAEENLANFYRNRQQDLAQKNELLLAKDVKIEDMRRKVEENIRKKKQESAYNKYAFSQKQNLLSFETEQRLENIASHSQNEKNRLNQNLAELEKELEAESRKIQMTKKETAEKSNMKFDQVTAYEKELMEKCFFKFSRMIQEARSDFNLAMESIEGEALETRRMAEREFRKSCLSYKQQLQEFYKNITRKDLETINELKHKIKNLEAEINQNTLKLNLIEKQNDDIIANNQCFPKKISTKFESKVKTFVDKELRMKKAFFELKKVEKLIAANENLEEEIQKVEEEANNLRNQFTLALSTVRDSAKLKSVILESKIDQIFNDLAKENDKSEPSEIFEENSDTA